MMNVQHKSRQLWPKRVLVLIALLVVGFILAPCFMSPSDYSPSELFERVACSPIPSSVKDIRVVRQFRPTLGEGSASIQFTVSGEDLETIRKAIDSTGPDQG